MPLAATPRSAIPELVWPAVPAGLPAQLLALQHQLAHTEWWPAEHLLRHQFRQLARLLDHAYGAIPFYRARLASLGYRPGQKITRQFWSSIPVLGRREVQALGPEIMCRELPAGHGQFLTDSTSGSTSTPLKIATTGVGQLMWQAITLREALWHGRDFRLKFAAIKWGDPEGRALPPAGRAFPSWGPPHADVFQTGPGALLDNRSTAAEQADWLLREEPDYLVTFPSIIHELARFFRHNGLRLKRLKSVNTMGEVVSPSLRAACREVFGVGVVDMYSAMEIGYLALQCPRSEHYHVQSEMVLLEVLTEAGQPCGPGEIGTVVVTPLLNYAMPLIRYAVGDYASPGESCSCGRGLPVLQEIHGRTRDLLMLPSGERRYAWVGMRTFAGVPDVIQFQVVQKTIYDLEVRLVTRRPFGAEQEEDIRGRLRKTLGAHFSIAFTYHDQIRRAPSGKHFEFISEVPG